jgi:hypothetical protein
MLALPSSRAAERLLRDKGLQQGLDEYSRSAWALAVFFAYAWTTPTGLFYALCLNLTKAIHSRRLGAYAVLFIQAR